MSIEIIVTEYFEKKARKIFHDDELEELYDFLQENPEYGDIIINTGGIRKVRWKNPKNNRGKSGGVRVLYYYKKNNLVLLLMIYEKSEQDNISEEEKHKLRKLLNQLMHGELI